jgi:predicted O-methyltransferase YrrM
VSTEATAYDAVAYPSTLFPSTHPDRLAAIARLHGLDCPAVETARVLEIGGGDGINAIAMAQAYPDAHFLSFDLAVSAAARGADIISSIGLGNIQVGAGDVCDAAIHLNQEFDYVIAHGVYAWVPQAVRDAVMVLIGRLLSPTGVAFVSYNALPGGHLRRIMREMTLEHVRPIVDPMARMTAAQAFLEDYAVPREGERPLIRAMRHVARPIADRHLSVLYHDEMGEVFEPQSLRQVVEAAEAQGLAFLNDANIELLDDGFPMEALSDEEVVSRAQASDYEVMAFFHSTLLIRPGRKTLRTPSSVGLRSLYMATRAERQTGHAFRFDDEDIVIGDDVLAEALAPLCGIWPSRVRVGDMLDDEERLQALYVLFRRGVVTLHATPLPGVRTPGDQPCASALARLQLKKGSKAVFTLDHRVIDLSEAGPRALVGMLDGTRDRAALARDWETSGFSGEISIDAALAQLAGAALLTR